MRTEAAPPVLTRLAKAAAGDAPLHVAGPTLEGTPFDRAAVDHLVVGMAAQLLIVEWQPAVAGGDGLARDVLADPPCDVIIVRAGELANVREVVVALGAGPNAPLLARLAQRWAEALGVTSSVLHRVETDDDVIEGRALCRAVAPGLRANVVVGRDLTNLLAETAAATGFVALGATEKVAVDRVAARTGAGQLAQRAAATVVVGRVRPNDPGR